MTSVSAVIEARGLVKKFGDVVALDGLDLTVHEGSVLGLLGPNGAGKTTAVRILTTLLKPDVGSATVAGFDVVKQANKVRGVIGLTGQYAAVDEYLTGRENLRMFGDLYHLKQSYVRERSEELLARFDLTQAADRSLRTYSGGMRRRLDLAASLIGRPSILFLDEPTTGLDPRSRIGLWEVITDLVAEGTTVLLTTQYLEEADQLAEEIVVIDHGRVIAQGTSDTLKDEVGGDRVEIVLVDATQLTSAVELLTPVATGDITTEPEDSRISLPVTGGSGSLIDVIRRLDANKVEIADVALRRPTLDDVFLTLTGHAAEDES